MLSNIHRTTVPERGGGKNPLQVWIDGPERPLTKSDKIEYTALSTADENVGEGGGGAVMYNRYSQFSAG